MSNNAQEILIKYLFDKKLATRVGSQYPPEAPNEFITVERSGGQRNQFQDHATFAIQAWADSTYKAAILADKIADALPGILELPEVMDVSGSRVYAWPDPDTRKARYQIIVSILVNINPS